LKKVEGIIKLYFESRLCDGIFCISRYLIDFYSDRGIPLKKLLLVPCTVDPSRFNENGASPLPFRYIAYFGSLTFKRDNIDNLIRAFDIINNIHPELHLVLGGFCSDKEKKQIEDLILELNISMKVMLLKYLPREEIVRYLKHSDILVNVRSKGLASQASFPSKLIEYLAAFKPVVTVDVGEISDYLVDGVNCYLVEPENSDKLSEKIEYIINNYELALGVAKRGKQLTDTTFNYNYQAKSMIGFINSLYS
jgi:glycosyltransferase involved in cell wall biosynthesis